MESLYRRLGGWRAKIWSSHDCVVRRRDEWRLVSLVGSLLRRIQTSPCATREMGRTRTFQASISLHRRSSAGARRDQHRVVVSHQQFLVPDGSLELRALILSRVGLCRLAWTERLRPTVHR